MAKARDCWLLKSEPDCFSIQDLGRCPRQTTSWSGVRNYQARNMMRDEMKLGDRVLFYHSSADPPAVAGTAIVVRGGYPDSTAWEPGDGHFDPKASPDNPIWQMVDIKLDEIFPRPIPIGILRGVKALANMELLRQGSRLSVQRVRPAEFEIVLQLAHRDQAIQQATPNNDNRPAAKPAAGRVLKKKRPPRAKRS